MPTFSTAVIGGGAAGIAATLSLRNAGSMVTCFEVAPTVGGLWNYHQPGQSPADAEANSSFMGVNTPIYNSMRCVLPKDFMCFSDHAFPHLVPNFPHHTAVKEYLQDLAMRKGVHALTRYNTRVIKLEWVGANFGEYQRQYDAMQANIHGQQPDDGGRVGSPSHSHNAVVISGVASGKNIVPRQGRRNYWRLRSANIITGDVHDWTFDSVVVATGRHHRPRYPGAPRSGPLEKQEVPLEPLPGQLRFQEQGGTIGHSSEMKKFREFTGKTVVVVGNGIGAMEHVAELQRHGAFVIHSQESSGADVGHLGRFEPTESANDLSLPSRRFMAKMRSFAERKNKLNEARLMRDLLSARNQKQKISLSAYFGQESNVTGDASSNPDFAVDANSLAAQFSYDPELIGRYMPVPTVGDIVGFECGRDVVMRTDRSSSKKEGETEAGGFLSLSRQGESYPIVSFLDKMTRKLKPAARDKILRKLKVDKTAGTVRVTDVDAVIFATGYYRDFSFFTDPEIRGALEGFPATSPSPAEAPAAAEGEDKEERKAAERKQQESKKNSNNLLYSDMFMGTLYRKNPTLGVLGLQSEILPPFLIFEAQSRFISSVFSRRISLPTTLDDMTEQEKELLGERGAEVLASPYGVGIGGSAAFYNGLQRLCGHQLSMPGYYRIALSERRPGWLMSGVMGVYKKAKAMRPQDRKRQHDVISNEI